jgi:hypothetical protein
MIHTETVTITRTESVDGGPCTPSPTPSPSPPPGEMCPNGLSYELLAVSIPEISFMGHKGKK